VIAERLLMPAFCLRASDAPILPRAVAAWTWRRAGGIGNGCLRTMADGRLSVDGGRLDH
jgi:hypothetical protein